jgi:hypothetical protein
MIFVSAATRGLHPYRSIVRDVLLAQGFDVAVEESFTTPEQPIISYLQRGLSRCTGMIALVGPYYGSESPVKDPDTGIKLSYSQYELVFALRQGLRVLVLMTDPNSQAELDTQTALPDEAVEKAALQAAFIERIRKLREGLGCLTFRNKEDLALILAKTRWEAWRH